MFWFDEQAGDTLLRLAVGAGFEKVVTMLLQRGADVNWANANMRLPVSTTHLFFTAHLLAFRMARQLCTWRCRGAMRRWP